MAKDTLSNPAKSAYDLAQKMRNFLALTETYAYSETNVNAEQERCAVVRVIDWGAFNQVIDQLELIHKGK